MADLYHRLTKYNPDNDTSFDGVAIHGFTQSFFAWAEGYITQGQMYLLNRLSQEDQETVDQWRIAWRDTPNRQSWESNFRGLLMMAETDSNDVTGFKSDQSKFDNVLRSIQ